MRKSWVIGLLFLLTFACSKPIDKAEEKEELLRINQEQRSAHLTNDAKLLVQSIADSLISVDSGNITINSNEAIEDRFASYFKTVKYYEWDDLRQPLIEVASSGELASMSVMKRTIIEGLDGKKDTTIFAWTSLFRKVNDHWKMYSITSTK